MKNYLAILGSQRFQMIALAWVLFWVGGGDVLMTLEGLLGTTAAVGTFDKWSKK